MGTILETTQSVRREVPINKHINRLKYLRLFINAMVGKTRNFAECNSSADSPITG